MDLLRLVGVSRVQVPNTGLLFVVEYVKDDGSVDEFREDIQSVASFASMYREAPNVMPRSVDVYVSDEGDGNIGASLINALPDVPRPDTNARIVVSNGEVRAWSSTSLIVVYPDNDAVCSVGCSYCYARKMHVVNEKPVFTVGEYLASYVEEMLDASFAEAQSPPSISYDIHVAFGGSVDITMLDADTIASLYSEALRNVKNGVDEWVSENEDMLNVGPFGRVTFNIELSASTSSPDSSKVVELAYTLFRLAKKYSAFAEIGITVHDEKTYKMVNSPKPSYEEYLRERASIIAELERIYQIDGHVLAYPMIILHDWYPETRKSIARFAELLSNEGMEEEIEAIFLGAHPPLPVPSRERLFRYVVDAIALMSTYRRNALSRAIIDSCISRRLFYVDTTVLESRYIHVCRGGRCAPAQICPRGQPRCIYAPH